MFLYFTILYNLVLVIKSAKKSYLTSNRSYNKESYTEIDSVLSTK